VAPGGTGGVFVKIEDNGKTGDRATVQTGSLTPDAAGCAEIQTGSFFLSELSSGNFTVTDQ
jgi:hypothetical protein